MDPMGIFRSPTFWVKSTLVICGVPPPVDECLVWPTGASLGTWEPWGLTNPGFPQRWKSTKWKQVFPDPGLTFQEWPPRFNFFLWDCRARWTFGIVIQHHQTIGELFSTTILKGVLIPEKKYFPNPLVQNNRVLTNENQQIKTNLVQCMNSSIIRFNLDFKYL